MSSIPRFLTVAETAALLRVSRSTIQRAIKSGRIRAVRPLPRVVRVDVWSVPGLIPEERV